MQKVFNNIFKERLRISSFQKNNTHVSDLRVIICGTARDVETKLDQFISVTQNTFQDFLKITYLVCESFSTDATWDKLQTVAREIEGFNIIKDSSNISTEDFRTVRIASARSKIQEFVRLRRDDFDIVVMMDLDGINRSLTRRALLSCWNYNNWDVATANQPLKYSDLWALRVSGWVDQDIWKMMEADTTESRRNNSKNRYLRNLTRSIPRKSPPILVESAFGGLAVYKTEAFISGEYGGVDSDGVEICEHVPFHLEISEKGFRIYIIPSLVNLNRIAQAAIMLKECLRKLRRLKKTN